MIAEHKYIAFLSYSHADERWARWVHRHLEQFVLSRAQVAANSDVQLIGRRLRPIFRDQEEMAASSDLSEVIQDGLRASRCLIVLCSQSSAQSRWVNEEIRMFRRLGKADQIYFVAIPDVAGSTTLSLPPAGTEPTGKDGAQVEPFVIDLRNRGKNRRLGLQKLTAAVANISLSEVTQRHARADRLRLAVGAAVAAGICILGIGATGFFRSAEIQQHNARLLELDRQASLLQGQIDSLGLFGVWQRATSLASEYADVSDSSTPLKRILWQSAFGSLLEPDATNIEPSVFSEFDDLIVTRSFEPQGDMIVVNVSTGNRWHLPAESDWEQLTEISSEWQVLVQSISVAMLAAEHQGTHYLATLPFDESINYGVASVQIIAENQPESSGGWCVDQQSVAYKSVGGRILRLDLGSPGFGHSTITDSAVSLRNVNALDDSGNLPIRRAGPHCIVDAYGTLLRLNALPGREPTEFDIIEVFSDRNLSPQEHLTQTLQYAFATGATSFPETGFFDCDISKDEVRFLVRPDYELSGDIAGPVVGRTPRVNGRPQWTATRYQVLEDSEAWSLPDRAPMAVSLEALRSAERSAHSLFELSSDGEDIVVYFEDAEVGRLEQAMSESDASEVLVAGEFVYGRSLITEEAADGRTTILIQGAVGEAFVAVTDSRRRLVQSRLLRLPGTLLHGSVDESGQYAITFSTSDEWLGIHYAVEVYDLASGERLADLTPIIGDSVRCFDVDWDSGRFLYGDWHRIVETGIPSGTPVEWVDQFSFRSLSSSGR